MENRWRGGRACGEGAVYSERGTGGRVAPLGWQRGAAGGLALGQSTKGQGQPATGQAIQRRLRTPDDAHRMVSTCSIHGTDSTSPLGAGGGKTGGWGRAGASRTSGEDVSGPGVLVSGGSQRGFRSGCR